MHGKDFFRDTVMCFFIIVTCINIATFILGSLFNSGAQFGYDAFLSPIIFGICGSLPNVVMYSKHELSLKELIIRKLFQIILLEIILVFVAFGNVIGVAADKEVIFPFCISVFVIFVVVHVISFLIDTKTARELNLELKSFQAKYEEN